MLRKRGKIYDLGLPGSRFFLVISDGTEVVGRDDGDQGDGFGFGFDP